VVRRVGEAEWKNLHPGNEDDRLQRRHALSALMDGDGIDAELACRAWRDDAGLRADWHAYHVIGEVMRSDDVHCVPGHDAQFLARLRERLAAQPVPLAPAATRRRVATGRNWLTPITVAAGFVAVAGVLVVMRVAAPTGPAREGPALLADSIAVPPKVGVQAMVAGPAAVAAGPSAPGSLVVDGALIRSAELDRYLAAHKQYSDTSALAMPGGGMVRNTATAAPGR
jgi:sigma-E factor negative regulatory protein RseA